MPPIKIQRQTEQTQLNPNGTLQRWIRIDFTVGDDGPFSVSVKAEDYNADTVHQMILEVANQTAALRAKVSGS